MTLRWYPYTLELKHPFTLATGSRTSTPAVLVEVEEEGIVGYGEASMPPYLGETAETASAFLSRVRLSADEVFRSLGTVLSTIEAIAPGNNAAKASVDIALHDWLGKKSGSAWHRIWGLDPEKTPLTSYTIGIGTAGEIRARVREAETFRVLKVKLGGGNDREIITAVREVTDKPIRVDVNQGWKTKEDALRMVEWLATRGVELVEQPLPKEWAEESAWLRERSPIPVIADEAVVRLADLPKAVGVFDGINVKLMKATGMHEAHAMMTEARRLGLKVMLGCMTETSCAISAAAQLSPLADWADLDGAALIRNDPFEGAKIVEGRIVMPTGPGIGVRRK